MCYVRCLVIFMRLGGAKRGAFLQGGVDPTRHHIIKLRQKIVEGCFLKSFSAYFRHVLVFSISKKRKLVFKQNQCKKGFEIFWNYFMYLRTVCHIFSYKFYGFVINKVLSLNVSQFAEVFS